MSISKKQQLIKETRHDVSLGPIVETTDAERAKRPKLPKKRMLRLQRRKKKQSARKSIINPQLSCNILRL
jgi:hypothetical protein